MPALVTRTVRLREDQELELTLKHKGNSGFLIRELLDIFWRAEIAPGTEIIKLRNKIKGERNGN